MVDIVSLVVAGAALAGVVVAIYGLLYQRAQLQIARDQIADTKNQLDIEKRKVVALETSAASAEKQLALLQQNVEAMKEWVKIAQSALEAEESSVGVMTGRAIHAASVKLKEALGRLLGK